MDIAAPPISSRPRFWSGLAILALVGLLVAAALLAYVGSPPTRLPAPFGPAGNGRLYYSSPAGDIFSVDTVTGTPRTIVAGPEVDSGPLPSRDGRRIAFIRSSSDGPVVMVADADGSNVRPLDGAYVGFSEIDWSPDDQKIAVTSTEAGLKSLTVIPVDGSPASTLPLGMEVSNFWYLPDSRIVFIGVGTWNGITTYGPYITDKDGLNPQPIVPPTDLDGDWIDLAPSPDGHSLVYHRWRGLDEFGLLHVIDIATLVDRPVAIDGTVPSENHESPQFSPDGTQLMFIRFTETGSRVTVVPIAGGRAVSFGPVGGAFEATPFARYAPDGRSILAYYPETKELWQLDPSGNGNDRKLTLSVDDLPTWQRVAP